jgi:crossover junction endodeoxyribonuclease RuvC
MRILGIDPGYGIIGFAILDVDGRKKTLSDCGVIRTPKNLDFPARLKEIHKDMQALLREYKPDTCSIEQVFFSKNVTTGIKVSQAVGVILLALHEAAIPIHEFSPSAMKAALTGDGRANKAAIQKMVKLELGLSSLPKPDDAADAVSLALTLASQLR